MAEKRKRTTITLDGERWTVREWGHLDRQNGVGGNCVYAEKVINLKPGLDAENEFRIIVHEILHVVFGWIDVDNMATDISEPLTVAGIHRGDGKDARKIISRLVLSQLHALSLMSEVQSQENTSKDIANALHKLGYRMK